VRPRPKPFAMLQVFVANAGRLLGKQELMQAVWPDIHVGEGSLFQCIREIRTALGDEDRELLRVVSGRGYLFEAEVVRVPAEIAAPAESAAADQTDDGKTPGTGRTQMLLADAYQRLGRRDDAAATMAKAMQARPGSTLQNFKLPSKNTSPLWLAAAEKIDRAVVAAGLPER
jgi:DNA-binding winged helix-turn-helix (wHTH) protein